MRELTDLEREMLQSARWLDLSHHRGELLKELHARAQRLEAALVMTEDQRDKALKEWEDVQRLVVSLQNLLENSRREIQAYDVAYYAAIAERDAARKALSDLRSSLVWEDK